MCKSVKLSRLRAFAWANFVPKLNLALTVTEHGHSTGQHDYDVQMLAEVFVTCSTEPQSRLNAWVREIGCLLTWHLPIKISAQRDAVHQGEKSFNLLHHADISDPADQLTVASSSAATTTMPWSTRTSCWPQTSSSRNRREKNCNCPRQSAFVELRVASLGHPWRGLAALATAATAAAAAAVVWHGHQLIPITFSAELDCTDLLVLICRPRASWRLLTSSSLEHQCTPWMSHVFW